jgi:hypothetical protein
MASIGKVRVLRPQGAPRPVPRDVTDPRVVEEIWREAAAVTREDEAALRRRRARASRSDS